MSGEEAALGVRSRRVVFRGVLVMTLLTGCAGKLVVDAQSHTMAGVTVACRTVPAHDGVNEVRLTALATPRCTTGDVTVEILHAGRALSRPAKSTKVIYANRSDDVVSNPFYLPPLGSWLTVEVTVVCDHAGAIESGRDTCQVVR